MNRINLRLRHYLTGLAGCVLLSMATATDLRQAEVLNFAVGWRTVDSEPENILQLGTVYPCAAGWCAVVENFAGSLNLQRQQLIPRHQMQANSLAAGCTDEHLTTIKGERSGELPANLKPTEIGYEITISQYRYSLRIDPENPSNLFLQTIEENNQIWKQQSQAVGFAYWSDDGRSSSFEREQYNFHFDGNIAHKNTLTGVRSDWQLSRTSIDLRKFRTEDGDPAVLSLTKKGHPEVLNRMSKQISAHHSLLPPQNNSGERLRYYNHEYGHDFNANGCFDEFGHNKLMLPILRNSAVIAFLFIEYTPDKLDGVPMLSVGRYFRIKH